MINVNEVYQNVQSLAEKAQHGTIRPVDFNRYATLASQDLYNSKIGSPNDFYKLGKAMPKTTSGMDKQVDQALRVFYVSDEVTPVVSGLATIPSTSLFIDKVSAGGYSVKWIPNNKVEEYINSTIDNPTTEYPVYTDLKTQIKVLPSSITSVDLSYYKTPASIIWNYTLVSNKPIYNPTGSVDFEWDSTYKLALITRILGFAGISIRDTELIQYANSEENTIS